MNYPLNLTSAAGGYAVANTEDEHRNLTASGYTPAFVEPIPLDADADYKSELTAKLLTFGVEADKRWGVKRLEEEIAKHG